MPDSGRTAAADLPLSAVRVHEPGTVHHREGTLASRTGSKSMHFDHD
ncbi:MULTISPECIES: hypothetical protein [Brevibacterium]|nr:MULTISPECIES: hypothetical protein [Brevibacterium]